MKLIFVRHADPDYENDSITERGWKEADALANRLAKLDVKEFFCSPLGRAKDTASVTLDKLGRTATELPWLEEFSPRIIRPDRPEKESVAWDWLPQDWTVDDRFYEYDHWSEHDVMEKGKVGERYDWIIVGFDELIERLGYRRSGRIYLAEKSNDNLYVFFCHFGVECVLLSRLLTVSPMILWHGFCALPTAVTEVVTEERRKGIASFRTLTFGDVSHLIENNIKPSFSARFRECYENEWERRD